MPFVCGFSYVLFASVYTAPQPCALLGIGLGLDEGILHEGHWTLQLWLQNHLGLENWQNLIILIPPALVQISLWSESDIVFGNNRCFIWVLIKMELQYLKERFFFGSANNYPFLKTGRDPKLQVCVKSSILYSSEVPFEIIITKDVRPDGLSENIQLKLIQNVEYV